MKVNGYHLPRHTTNSFIKEGESIFIMIWLAQSLTAVIRLNRPLGFTITYFSSREPGEAEKLFPKQGTSSSSWLDDINHPRCWGLVS